MGGKIKKKKKKKRIKEKWKLYILPVPGEITEKF